MVTTRTFLFLLIAGTTCGSLASGAESVLLQFSSASCGPCQQMRPVMQRLQAAGYPIRKIDINQDPRTAQRFQVTRVPTFIVVVNDRETARLRGSTSYGQLEEMMVRGGISPVHQPRSPSPVMPPANGVGLQTTFASDRGPMPPANAGLPTIEMPATSMPAAIQSDQNFPQLGPIVANQPGAAAEISDDLFRRLVEASVKLTVSDPEGTSSGSGTIVDTQVGKALVLTCGHIFRDSAGKGPITVTLFQAMPQGAVVKAKVEGRLLDYDLKRDLALVSIDTGQPVRAVAIGPPLETQLTLGMQVTSVGCSHGANPTAIRSQITANNRYVGPANVEVAGAPIEGRSGGGLFNEQGQLLGVCYAADPQGDEGLYASLPSIQAKLDSLGLAKVYRSPILGGGTIVPLEPQPETLAVAQGADFPVRGQGPVVELKADEVFAAGPAAVQPESPVAQLAPAEQAALEEILRRGTNSEVVCIIRPKTPDGKSEVITLQNVSPEFIRALTARRSPASAAASGLLR